MSEIPVNMGFTEAPPAGAAASPPAQPSPAPQQPAENPRSRGHSPSKDARETALTGGERRITVGGVERPEQEVLDIMAAHAQQQIVKAGLPASPDEYEIKLPENFKPPEGLRFEINANDPALAEARKAAHEMGLDQAGFSRLLGYASTRVGELAATNAARADQMNKLGAAGPQRIEAIETWLAAKVGDKANIAIATLKQYPIAANVEMFETITCRDKSAERSDADFAAYMPYSSFEGEISTPIGPAMPKKSSGLSIESATRLMLITAR